MLKQRTEMVRIRCSGEGSDAGHPRQARSTTETISPEGIEGIKE